MKKQVVSTFLDPEVVTKIDESRAIAGLSRYTWLAKAIAEKLERESHAS